MPNPKSSKPFTQERLSLETNDSPEKVVAFYSRQSPDLQVVWSKSPNGKSALLTQAREIAEGASGSRIIVHQRQGQRTRVEVHIFSNVSDGKSPRK